MWSGEFNTTNKWWKNLWKLGAKNVILSEVRNVGKQIGCLSASWAWAQSFLCSVSVSTTTAVSFTRAALLAESSAAYNFFVVDFFFCFFFFFFFCCPRAWLVQAIRETEPGYQIHPTSILPSLLTDTGLCLSVCLIMGLWTHITQVWHAHWAQNDMDWLDCSESHETPIIIWFPNYEGSVSGMAWFLPNSWPVSRASFTVPSSFVFHEHVKTGCIDLHDPSCLAT